MGWLDLWTWFDPADVYQHGAGNLWCVLLQMSRIIQAIETDVETATAFRIGIWADAWCQVPDNATRLMSWDGQYSSLYEILGNGSDAEASLTDFSLLSRSQCVTLFQALTTRRNIQMGYDDVTHNPTLVDVEHFKHLHRMQDFLGM